MRISHIFLMGLAFFAAAVFNTWVLPLTDLDEGAFAEATREMLASGNYWMTYLNGELRSDKPIFTYWLQSLSVSIFGQTEIAYRLPSILAGFFWMLTIYRFTFELSKNREAALFAATGMILCLGPSMISKAATADALLNLFLALSLLNMYRYHQNPKPLTAITVFFFLGLGALTKGPVALAIPVFVSFAFFAYTGRLGDWLKALINPIGWLVFIGILSTWLVPLYLHDPTAFADFFGGFIGTHNMQRFSEGLHGEGKWWFYIIMVPVVLLPMTMLLARAPTWLRQFKTGGFETFTIIWFVIVFVLISASQTQFPHYGLYLATPLFVLFGLSYNDLPRKWVVLSLPVFMLILFAILPWTGDAALPSAKHSYDRAVTQATLENIGSVWLYPMLAALTGLLLMLLRISTAKALIIVGFLQVGVVWGVIAPAYTDARQAPVQTAVNTIETLDPDNKRTVVSYFSTSKNMPSFSVYRQAITPLVKPRRKSDLMQEGVLVFTRADLRDDLQQDYPSLGWKLHGPQGQLIVLEATK